MNTEHGPPWTRVNGYETLDYFLAPDRWRNTVKNVEADTSGFIPSDHYPLTAEIHVKFKAEKPKEKLIREKFEKCNIDEYLEYNQEIENLLEKPGENQENPSYEQFANAIQKAAKHIPKQPPKRKRPHISDWLQGFFKTEKQLYKNMT